MCRIGCETKDHASWGECLRAANLKVAFCGIGGGDATKQKRWDNDLQAYRDARAQGIQPSATTRSKVDLAVALSNESGTAFDAGNPVKVESE